ncbi:P-loop guanosine triphosphatase YjiA [Methylobacterium crusticola]|uniref:P-loop guanosine triphosphatase YjiA n=1 Tax=Methylobacterium crusticola TaxID=1697972 RepID=A0ABQ4QUD7_9HYPH|nr:GTP-binding protein [Methylobacterium crusticola]GJD48946.1 P-loop guanosine triphosphatase YjiA [Methylobacterium crusticola]
MSGPDFVVLTGFLGSGKTTLLRDVLARPEAADTAVIVNEVGEIGLDAAILREEGGPARMAMLANGCVCCQLGSDLAATVDALLHAARPGAAGPLRRIILETSGLSRPGPVLRQLASLAEYRMRVSVVATFDALRGTATADFAEAAAQWAAAHRIVLTKADLVAAPRLAAARAEAAGLNPLAEIVATADRAAAVAGAFASLAPAPGRAPALPAAATPHPRIAVHLARPAGLPAYDDVATWLDNLAGALGERLLRLKGLVRVAGSAHPLLVQSVGTLFSPPRPFRDPGSAEAAFLVVITRDAGPEEIAAVAPAGLFALAGRGGAALAPPRGPLLARAEAVEGPGPR